MVDCVCVCVRACACACVHVLSRIWLFVTFQIINMYIPKNEVEEEKLNIKASRYYNNIKRKNNEEYQTLYSTGMVCEWVLSAQSTSSSLDKKQTWVHPAALHCSPETGNKVFSILKLDNDIFSHYFIQKIAFEKLF